MPVMFEAPIEFLHERLTYNPDTGELRWKPRQNMHWWNEHYAGKVAGTSDTKGYICVSLGRNRVFKAHRIAFAMVHNRWPGKLDHINRISTDNRIANLREATHAQNMQNVDRQGFKKYPHGYRAQIGIAGKQMHLGCFKTKEEARSAYLAAKLQHHSFYTGG